MLQSWWQKPSEPCQIMNPKASADTDPPRDLFRIELQPLVDRPPLS